MKTTYLSSTDLKRKTAEILNLVAFGDTVAIIRRHGESLVKIIPARGEVKMDIEEKTKKYFGAIPDFPLLVKKRHFRKRNLNL